MFQDGPIEPALASIPRGLCHAPRSRVLGRAARRNSSRNGQPAEASQQTRASSARRNRCWPVARRLVQALRARALRTLAAGATSSGSIASPLSNFKPYCTLFSKFFPSFPHGTCSLSVSRRYLALDGGYHPLRAAFPNNPTRRSPIVPRVCPTPPAPTGLSPSPAPLSRGDLRQGPRERQPVDYNSGRRAAVPILTLSCSLFARRYWGNPC